MVNPKSLAHSHTSTKKEKNINTLKKKKQRMTQVTFLKYTTTAHFKTIKHIKALAAIPMQVSKNIGQNLKQKVSLVPV